MMSDSAPPPPSYEMYNNLQQVPGSQNTYPVANPVGMAPSGNYGAPVVMTPANPRPSSSQKMLQGVFICLRELFGMAIFTYVACMGYGSMLSAGLIYMVLQASAEISSAGGLHLNPVISIAVVIAGKMQTPLLVIPMIFCQFVGCLIGAGFCRGSQTKEQFEVADHYDLDYSEIHSVEELEELAQYCFGEMLLTCILVTVFLRLFPLTTRSLPSTQAEVAEVEKRKYIHALFVGLTIVALTGVKFTAHFNGVMNPFSAFGPLAIRMAEYEEGKLESDHRYGFYPKPTPSEVEDMWKGHWIYWVGPLIGAVLAGFIDRVIGIILPRQ